MMIEATLIIDDGKVWFLLKGDTYQKKEEIRALGGVWRDVSTPHRDQIKDKIADLNPKMPELRSQKAWHIYVDDSKKSRIEVTEKAIELAEKIDNFVACFNVSRGNNGYNLQQFKRHMVAGLKAN